VETNLTRTDALILCEWYNDVLVDEVDSVAEGVDSMEQALYLRDKAWYEVQGFLISHPLPVVRVERLLSAVGASYDWEKKGFSLESAQE